MPSVGAIDYHDVISGSQTNYQAPAGGRGYYRPASLVSLWATAPYLHNNALGAFLNDPSTKGRVVQFYDGIRRLLWNANRKSPTLVLSPAEWDWLDKVQAEEQKAGSRAAPITRDRIVSHEGDLRTQPGVIATNDPGYIYRLPNDTYVRFARGSSGRCLRDWPDREPLPNYWPAGPGSGLFWPLFWRCWRGWANRDISDWR